MNLRRWRPDRAIDRGPLWVAIDLAVAYFSAVISIGPSDHVASAFDGPPLERAAAVVWFAAIAGRRFAPGAALWAASAATVAVALAGLPVTNASLATAMALVLVLRSRPLRFAVEASCVPVAAVLIVLAPQTDAQSDAFVSALVAHAVAVVVGRAGRVRWEAQEAMRLAELAAGRAKWEAQEALRAAEVEWEREAAAERVRQARAAERTRMARELHDAVGHAVTVMVAHAGAARFALAGDQEPIRTALGSIEQVGREAMRDLDGILGLLADDEAAVDGDLEESLRALLSSLPAEVTAELRLPADQEPLRGLDFRVSAAVRRVVQESLTNVIRHARPAHAVIEVDGGDGWIRVVVRDNGSGAPASSRRGRGLAGMRERVEALGGRLESGPAASGGWENRVRLPLVPDPVEEAA